MKYKARFSENELLEKVAVAFQCEKLGIDAVFESMEHLIEHSAELVQLKDKRGVRAFTTKAMLRLEKTMLERAERLHNKTSHAIPIKTINNAIRKHSTLRPDQVRAIRAIAEGSDIVPVIGVAGSGKTFMMSIVRKIFEQHDFRVVGTSLASKATKGLENDSGIKSLHIHKLLSEIENGRFKLDSRVLLIIDESGMVSTRHMEKLLSLVEQAGAKVALVGDYKQLQSIEAGAPLRMISEEIGASEMTTIIRQREQWARDIVKDFRDGKAEKALAVLHEHGQLVIAEDREEAMQRLVMDWAELVFEKGGELKENLVFAGINVDVRELNCKIQDELLKRKQLGDYSIEVDGLDFYLGDRVMITKNHRLKDLRNGTMGEVVGVKDQTLWVLTEDGIEVELDCNEFSDITLAYGLSAHKSQGMTCENALILTGDVMTDREFSYVTGSRARGNTFMYSDELSVGGIEELAARMNESRPKEMAMEHKLEIE